MRFDPNCNVHRVGPNSAWADMEDGDVRHTDVVLVDNVSGEYIVAVIDEDDSYDFDSELRSELSGAMRFLYKLTAQVEKRPGAATRPDDELFCEHDWQEKDER